MDNFINTTTDPVITTGTLAADYNTATSAAMTLRADAEKEYTTIRQLRPELLDEIYESLNKYTYKDAVEVLNFKSGVIDNEVIRRSQESPFANYKGRYYMIRLDKDINEPAQTYIFKIEDTFLAEDDKTYWRYKNADGYINCTDLFDFMAYASVCGYVFDRKEAPRWFGNKKAENYELRKNNLFGIDRDGRLFCTECTSINNVYASSDYGRRWFDVAYAQEITENQYQYIESVIK